MCGVCVFGRFLYVMRQGLEVWVSNMSRLPLLFRQSPVKSFRMWKAAFNEITPLQHALAKSAGHFWGMLGGSCATSALFLQLLFFDGSGFGALTMFGFGVFVGAISYLQFVEWRKAEQQIKGIRDMNERIGIDGS